MTRYCVGAALLQGLGGAPEADAGAGPGAGGARPHVHAPVHPQPDLTWYGHLASPPSSSLHFPLCVGIADTSLHIYVYNR